MRLIDADALKGKLPNTYRNGFENCRECRLLEREEVNAYIDGMPTVDAAPVVHGRWQWLSSTFDRTPCEMRYMCSKCHHETITHGHKPWEKYCPSCGAKMDLEG